MTNDPWVVYRVRAINRPEAKNVAVPTDTKTIGHWGSSYATRNQTM